jgi:hypothetical protein
MDRMPATIHYRGVAYAPRMLAPTAIFAGLGTWLTGPPGLAVWVCVWIGAALVMRRLQRCVVDAEGVVVGRRRIAPDEIAAVDIVETPDVSLTPVLRLVDGTSVPLLGGRELLRGWAVAQPRSWVERADRCAAAVAAVAGLEA